MYQHNPQIFTNHLPTKLTYARRLRMRSLGWGPILSFHLESVKLNCRNNAVHSAALLKISDKSGKVTVLIEGLDVGIVFGLDREDWKKIEGLCPSAGELFYRRFKDGIGEAFCIQQKMFYSFCQTNQTGETFFVSYRRLPNRRRGEARVAFLRVIDAWPICPANLKLYLEKFDSFEDAVNKPQTTHKEKEEDKSNNLAMQKL